MNVLLGVSGSISAYKSVEIMRTFQKGGHHVSVILTKSAMKFITPLTFETFTPGKVYTDMFEMNQDPIPHITLSKENELFLIAPATANVIGKWPMESLMIFYQRHFWHFTSELW
jgi:phosphopantothenoylcysteine synthetase/decarboxylase